MAIICEKIYNKANKIVPIIGDESFMYVSETGKETSLREYIIASFMNEYDYNGDTQIFHESFYGLTQLSKTFESEYIDSYESYMQKALDAGRIKLRPSVKQFLDTYQFPLIITTSCFPCLELQLSKSYKADYWDMHHANKALEDGNNVIYHLLGLAGHSVWAYNEEQLLFILQTMNKFPPDLFDDDSLPMFISSSLPNWIFRFLWSPFNREYPSKKKQRGYWLGNSDDVELLDFLNDISYKNLNEIDTILNELSKMKQVPATQAHVNTSRHHDFEFDAFLSYASEDCDLMLRIKAYLEENYQMRIWCAYGETDQGGDYWQRIQCGIEQSRYFIPLVTPNYIRRFLGHKRRNQGKVSGLENESNRAINWFLKHDGQSHDGIVYPQWFIYSLPIVMLDLEYEEEVINQAQLEEWAQATDLPFPRELFYPVQMYFYTENEAFKAKATFYQQDWSEFVNLNR